LFLKLFWMEVSQTHEFYSCAAALHIEIAVFLNKLTKILQSTPGLTLQQIHDVRSR